MKASIGGNMTNQALLVLTPESDEDRLLLGNLASMTGPTCIINHRGFRYMEPETEFLIQKMPRGD